MFRAPVFSLCLFSVPSQPPQNVRAISVTSDEAAITWAEPPRMTLHGVLKGYRVVFWAVFPDGGNVDISKVQCFMLYKLLRRRTISLYSTNLIWTSFELVRLSLCFSEWGEMQNITTTKEQVALKGLEKFTNYSIQVLAYTQAGDGVRSNVLYIQTREDCEFTFSELSSITTLPRVMFRLVCTS